MGPRKTAIRQKEALPILVRHMGWLVPLESTRFDRGLGPDPAAFPVLEFWVAAAAGAAPHTR